MLGASKALQSPQVSAAEDGSRLNVKTQETLRNDTAFGSVIWEKENWKERNEMLAKLNFQGGGNHQNV